MVADHVEPRRRDEGAEACEQVERFEVDGGGAVLPGPLEAVADAAVLEPLEAVLGDGRPAEVATEALDLTVIGAMQRAGGVQVEAVDDGDGLVGAGLARVDQPQRGLAGAEAEQAQPLGRGRAADGPAGGLGPVLLLGTPLEQRAHPRRGTASHVGHLLGRGRW